jgi:uncharacterized protein
MITTLPSGEPKAPLDALPIGEPERLSLLDVLRGFALGGVFLSNVNVWFSGTAHLPKARLEALTSARVDVIFGYLFRFLVNGKMATIFSFLFGLGFAIQMSRAEERGASVVPTYARRLVVLLILGVGHMFALWYGDILSAYAIMGFALLLFRRRSDRALLTWGFALALTAPLLSQMAEKFLPMLLMGREAAEAAAKASKAEMDAMKAAALAGFESDSYVAAMRGNAIFLFGNFLRPRVAWLYALNLGKFLLGFYAGRRRLFHEVENHVPLFRRFLFWGLAVGAPMHIGLAVLRYLRRSQVIQGEPSWGVVLGCLGEIGNLGLGLFYVSAIALLFRRPVFRRALSAFAPAGRMALTNYLSQTVIALLLFYGFGLGLMGKVGTAMALGLTAGLFAVQMLLSALWLSRFQCGPVEWLWRSLTYWRAQPLRHRPAPLVSSLAPRT